MTDNQKTALLQIKLIIRENGLPFYKYLIGPHSMAIEESQKEISKIFAEIDVKELKAVLQNLVVLLEKCAEFQNDDLVLTIKSGNIYNKDFNIPSLKDEFINAYIENRIKEPLDTRIVILSGHSVYGENIQALNAVVVKAIKEDVKDPINLQIMLEYIVDYKMTLIDMLNRFPTNSSLIEKIYAAATLYFDDEIAKLLSISNEQWIYHDTLSSMGGSGFINPYGIAHSNPSWINLQTLINVAIKNNYFIMEFLSYDKYKLHLEGDFGLTAVKKIKKIEINPNKSYHCKLNDNNMEQDDLFKLFLERGVSQFYNGIKDTVKNVLLEKINKGKPRDYPLL